MKGVQHDHPRGFDVVSRCPRRHRRLWCRRLWRTEATPGAVGDAGGGTASSVGCPSRDGRRSDPGRRTGTAAGSHISDIKNDCRLTDCAALAAAAEGTDGGSAGSRPSRRSGSGTARINLGRCITTLGIATEGADCPQQQAASIAPHCSVGASPFHPFEPVASPATLCGGARATRAACHLLRLSGVLSVSAGLRVLFPLSALSLLQHLLIRAGKDLIRWRPFDDSTPATPGHFTGMWNVSKSRGTTCQTASA